MKIHIRQAIPTDALAIAQVHVKSWQTTYRGIINDDYIDSLDINKKQKTWTRLLQNQERPTWVLWVDNEIVGFASAGANRTANDYDGELYALYFLKSFQGKGLGRKLMIAAAQNLLEMGFKAMQVWVLRDNPSVGFYKKCGGIFIDSQILTIGKQDVIEDAYVWADLAQWLTSQE